MRGDEFTFDITHKHILAGNSKPRLKGDDFAMVRRMVLIPFTQKFEGLQRDDYLHEKLKAEYAGILNWFIEGARKWSESGLLIPSTIKESTAEYMAQQNDIQLWIEECCTVGDGLRVGSREAYTSYKFWKESNGEHPESNKAFSPRLEKLHEKSSDRVGAFFKGLSINPNAQQSGDYERNSRGF
jgi:putative DNA primase/helicase